MYRSERAERTMNNSPTIAARDIAMRADDNDNYERERERGSSLALFKKRPPLLTTQILLQRGRTRALCRGGECLLHPPNPRRVVASSCAPRRAAPRMQHTPDESASCISGTPMHRVRAPSPFLVFAACSTHTSSILEAPAGFPYISLPSLYPPLLPYDSFARGRGNNAPVRIDTLRDSICIGDDRLNAKCSIKSENVE